MLVKILDAEPEFVEKLKQATGETTASKAYATAADNYQLLQNTVIALQESNQRYRRELSDAYQTIDMARFAARALIDTTDKYERNYAKS